MPSGKGVCLEEAMIDDLRAEVGNTPVFDDEEEASSSTFDQFNQFDQFEDYDEEEDAPTVSRRRRRNRLSLGMTAAQRALIAAMLFFMSCILSTFCLLATGKLMP